MTITNKYAGRCRTCGKQVDPGRGHARKENCRWIVYCPDHVPERKVPATSTERTLDDQGRITMPYDPEALPLLRSFPGARWDGERKQWSVSLDAGDRPRVLELAERLGLEVAPELRHVEQSQRAKAADGKGLYPFQVAGVDFLVKKRRALLGDDMGLGKTVQVLMALPREAKCLAVVPACVKHNWAEETRKWRPDLAPYVASGRDGFRWPEAGEVVIVNYDILPSRLKIKEYQADLPAADREAARGVTLVIDECHFTKNSRALRSKRVKCLAQVCSQVWGLTGTPLLNRPGDLYGVLSSLELARETFGGFGKFKKLFNAYQGRWGLEWGSPQPEVPEMLRRTMLRRMRTEVLPDLPGKTRNMIVVNGLTGGTRAAMDAIWADHVEAFGDEAEAGRNLPAFEEMSRVRAELAEERTSYAVEYAENCEEQDVPLVVFSAHRAPVEALGQRDGWAMIAGGTAAEERQRIVQAFQAGELKGVALTIGAGGVGLTLTRAWRMLFVDLDWVPANNLQAEDRICRIGQRAAGVQIDVLTSDHPLDLRVNELLAEKMKMIEAAVEAAYGYNSPKPAEGPDGETEAEFAERQATIAKIQAEQEQAVAKANVERYRANRNEAEVPKLTETLRCAIKAAVDFMAGRCDFAQERDGEGFNKADTFAGHALAACGEWDDTAYELGYLILRGYPRQLKDRYPLIFA